jgi:hypothetical protein
MLAQRGEGVPRCRALNMPLYYRAWHQQSKRFSSATISLLQVSGFPGFGRYSGSQVVGTTWTQANDLEHLVAWVSLSSISENGFPHCTGRQKSIVLRIVGTAQLRDGSNIPESSTSRQRSDIASFARTPNESHYTRRYAASEMNETASMTCNDIRATNLDRVVLSSRVRKNNGSEASTIPRV